jgi:hypothetical protein
VKLWLDPQLQQALFNVEEWELRTDRPESH